MIFSAWSSSVQASTFRVSAWSSPVGATTPDSARSGIGSGAYLWAGSATGEAATVVLPTGTASAAYALAASATGETHNRGSALGSVAWAGSVVGQIEGAFATGNYYLVATAAHGERLSSGTASGAFALDIISAGIETPQVWRFEPPTYMQEVPRRLTGGPRYRLTESMSVVRINGSLQTVKTPSHGQLIAAGAEGTDWFIGGNIYRIDQEVAEELTASGFAPERELT